MSKPDPLFFFSKSWGQVYRSQCGCEPSRLRRTAKPVNKKRNKFASFGNRDDALEVANADSAMRESSPDPPLLQRLPGLHRVIRRRSEAGVPAVGKTALLVLARRVPGVRETADPQRGIKANRALRRHPQRQFASLHRCLHPCPLPV